MSQFLFREASARDVDSIVELARHLDTLNLPPAPDYLSSLVHRSVESFAGGEHPDDFAPGRRFLFVLEGPEGQVVGTSMIHAQHGTPDEPHVFFRVDREERFARLSLEPEQREVHMVHTMLTLGQTYQGPTEVGGLVLDPSLRKHPEKLGRLLSLGRFVYMAAARRWFRDKVLAELLPPLQRGPGGTRSPLWDALGRRFTGLSYAEADRLSMGDKEFIWRLFPVMPIHASLLPLTVQDIIGEVGRPTIGAQRLLQSIGFHWNGCVDPFDGGPHYEAHTDEITLVRDARYYRPEIVEPGGTSEGADTPVPAIVGRVDAAAPHFRAVWTTVRLHPDHSDAQGGADGSAGADAPAGEGAASDDEEDALEAIGMPAAAIGRLGWLDADGKVREGARVLAALRPKRRRADRMDPSITGAYQGIGGPVST